ncbi:TPA: hypothetical protein MEA34_000594 [Klebsiella aerogenes]|nr:hypothetical protein [Klebsiella aerogenes]
MRKIIFPALFLVASAHATNQPTMMVFKCSPEHSKNNTIVTWQDVKKQDGWHRYASWKDKEGEHYGIELYFNGSSPNKDGQIEDIYVFGNMDSQKKISGPAISMILNKKAKLLTYSITNDLVGADVHNPLEKGTCTLSDKG